MFEDSENLGSGFRRNVRGFVYCISVVLPLLDAVVGLIRGVRGLLCGVYDLLMLTDRLLLCRERETRTLLSCSLGCRLIGNCLSGA